MLFRKPDTIDRHEDRRRPCEVDGSKAWYHGLIHCDRTVVRMNGIFSSDRYAELERALQYKQVFPSNCQMHVERRTYAMVEYLDGSVSKVDPEQVHFIDV